MPLDRVLLALTARPPSAGRSLVLALRALGLGDLLTAVPALRALAAAFRDHRLVLAAPARLAPLAALAGAVDDVIPTEGLRPLAAAVHGADLAVNLHGRGPESHRILLATGPRRLIAHARDDVAGAGSGPPWREDQHDVLRWCRLLEADGIRADPTRLDLPPPPVPPPAAAEGATVVHPGAASVARRWPAARFASVAAAEADAGRKVVVTGGAGEVALARAVARLAGLPGSAVLAGRTDVLGLAAVVAAAGRIVCGDTGVAHLATALGTPSVVLFGPVPPSRWGPPPDRPWHRALWAGLAGDPHGAWTDPGLLRISVDDVLAALADLPAPEGRELTGASPPGA